MTGLCRHETSRLKLGGSWLVSWLGRNRMLVLLLGYAAMLGAIGLLNSQGMRRWLRRSGWSS